jgi:hypothetical protein
MTDVKICEHDGIYTAYHIKISRGPDGRLQKIPVQIHIPIPNAKDLFSLKEWTENLTDSQLNVAAQIFYDKWNFSSGDGRNKLILEALTDERETREDKKKEDDIQFSMFNTWPHQKKKKKGSNLINKMRNRINASGNKITAASPGVVIQGSDMASRIRQRVKDKKNGI